MSAAAVHTSGKVIQGQQDHINSVIAEKVAEDQGDVVIMGLPAPTVAAPPASGLFSRLKRLLQTLGDQMFRTPGVNDEAVETPDADYWSYGSCCCC